MNTFYYGKNDVLAAGNVVLSEIVKYVGTPCYAYNGGRIVDNFDGLENSISGENEALICYALKANSTLGILKILAGKGCGAECVSAGEIRRAILAGIPAEKIIFDGVGKTKSELQYALDVQIKQVNAESLDELEDLNFLAAKRGKDAPVALRVNTDTDAQTHRYLTTGRSCDKFGLSVDVVKNLCQNWRESFPNLNFRGFSSHTGSQITSLTPYAHSFGILRSLVQFVHRNTDLKVETLDLGGGIGICYSIETSKICLRQFGNLVKQTFSDLKGVELLFEPGRHLVGDAGCLITSVICIKTLEDGTECAIVDASMNDLLRPALYGAYHEILPLKKPPKKIGDFKYLIAGSICESADTFRENTNFSMPLDRGDLLAIMDCGAYGFSMASRYNSRPLPAEVLIKDGSWNVIGRRETLEDALNREIF